MRSSFQLVLKHLVSALATAQAWVGFRKSDYALEAILQRARAEVGGADFEDLRFMEPLRLLVDDVRAHASSHRGLWAHRESTVQHLEARLRIEAYLRQHPDAHQQTIESPLFVLGLPRTGSTLLHRLLACDPQLRFLRGFEANHPVPLAEGTPEQQDAARIARARLARQVIYLLEPRLVAIHPFAVEGPEECTALMAPSFDTFGNGGLGAFPKFSTWLEGRSQVPAYVEYKQRLEVLEHQRGGARWLLKGPLHSFGVAALLEVFPDACIIQTHRDPVEAIPSTVSLMTVLAGLSEPRPDRYQIGRDQLHFWSLAMDRVSAARLDARAGQFCDVQYAELVADPIATVERLYRHFGLELGSAARQRMCDWLAQNRQHKRGVHRYDMADFGLTKRAIGDAFERYRADFGFS